MENCSVSIFKLPGLKFKKNELSPELLEEIETWSKANNCGTKMTDTLWGFKSDKQRAHFVLRWADQILNLSAIT